MYQLKVRAHFDAAHYIKDYPGKCAREHGHRWDVEVVLGGKELGTLNMLVDFSVVKNVLKTILDANYDHYQLNERFHEEHVTAEFLSRELFRVLRGELVRAGITTEVVLDSVIVYESPDCGVRYYEPAE